MSVSATSFSVRTEPAGHQFEVAADQTILEAALAQRIGLPYGCRRGTCGSCTAQLQAGQVEYPSGNTEALAGQPADACLTCQAVPTSDLVLRVAELERLSDIEVRTLPCRLAEKTRLNHDVMRLRLKLPEGQRLAFVAGQYLELMLRDGTRRAYSIANPPQADELLELHLRRVPGGRFSDEVFERMEERCILRIRGPLGTFVLREDSERPILMVAGGTGFAPLKAMLEHAFHRRIERPIELYWGVRSRRDLYQLELPARWAEAHPNFSWVPVLSEPDPDWSGRTGWVHQAVLEDHPSLADFDCYLSGPPPMVEAGRAAFEAAGASIEHLFSDAFEYAADFCRAG
ncbi:MAG: CDP-6-deoxy-delta-3,4-glucoseen reductase [Lamprobacter sp.]|uniref:CDP-6-deoxy-delta-3,4-glucoseen reductase n=1 Tax=Lamprobacter sp. TaxID=3100796 RepID=UPI002B257BBB|nr:CDP-6-deoxy-delta-3,4-glucoseen reductase [Lamprobacter sp.]MEA3639364.1 CDP-6-deoxy-delta-3,4-glucoseen reductase [Lamprobacter sp.]